MGHLYQLTQLPHPTRHRWKGHKECNSQNIGKNAKKAIFWTWHGHTTHKLTATIVNHTRSSQSILKHGKETTHEVPLLAKGLLVVDSYYRRGSNFSSGVWLLVGYPRLSEWPNTNSYVGSTNWMCPPPREREEKEEEKKVEGEII